MFDCGRLGKITNSEILSLSDIFISHTHMDHFYGFDRVIRGSITADKTIRIFGPPGIIKNVTGKIEGYTWNLIKSYKLIIEVIELNKETQKFSRAVFSAYEGFVPIYDKINANQLKFENDFKMDFEFFDHGITSVGYRITEPEQITVNKEKLTKKKYLSGKWLGELQSSLKNNLPRNKKIKCLTEYGETKKTIKELENDIIEYKKPQSITFITDIAPTFENVQTAIKFCKKSTILLIESMFTKNEISHAILKKHLTVDLAKHIFNESDSQFVNFFHFAPRYEMCKNDFFAYLYSGFKEKILKLNELK
jgi:ribonuclease Z